MFSTHQQVGRYKIISHIGSGGMGEVFLAWDSQLERKVAVKILSKKFTESAERMKRFIREAKTASALNHPNILIIHEIGEAKGAHFIATEFIEGETLRDRLNKSLINLAEIIDIVIQVSAALSAAHEAGIVHRDIKPDNLMIRPDGYVKILDFGLAKLVESKPIQASPQDPTRPQLITQAGMILGTVPYMSPEQARGKPVDARSDIFSLGIVLYEMLTRHHPFSGETINHTIVSILEKEPPPLSQFLQDYPPDIEIIIEKCLAKDLNKRYQTAKDLLASLRALKQEIDFQANNRRKIPSDLKSETKTTILNVHTGKTVNKETGLNVLTQTERKPLFSLTDKVRNAIKSRSSIPLILILVLSGLAAYFILPVFRETPPKSEAVMLFDSGMEGLREGAYYKASKLFEDSIKIENDFANAHAGLAEAWMELDYFGRAQSEMLKVNEIQNKKQTFFSGLYKTDDSYYIDAVNATVVRDFPEAIKIYQKIAERKPNEPYVYLDLGRAYEKNEDIDKAVECYRKAVNLNSQYGAGFLRLGMLLRRKTEYEKSNEAFDKAENIYDRLSNDEGVAEVRYQRGVSFNFQEKLDHALTQFELVIRNHRANKYQQIRAMMQISSVCSSMGKTACAEEYAVKAINLAKQERMENLASNGLINLGNAFLTRGQYDKAEQNFLQAIDFSRKDEGLYNEARAFLSMGSLRIQQKKPEATEEFVRQALPFLEKGGYQKEIVQANLLLGRVYELKEDFDSAFQAFTQVVNSAAASPADKAYAEMILGIIFMKKENYPAALNHHERSYDLYKSINFSYYMAYSLFYIVECLNQLGNFEKAEERLSEAENILQAAPIYQTQLLPRVNSLNAQIALSQRNFAGAVKEANQAQKSTDSSVAFEADRIVCLGQYYANSRNDKAIKYCNKALQYAVGTKNSRAINTTKLTLAEIYLISAKPSEALENALQAKDYFVSAGQLESGWRASLMAARASQQKGDAENTKTYAHESSKLLSQLQSIWGEKFFNDYRGKPDISFYINELEKLSTFQ